MIGGYASFGEGANGELYVANRIRGTITRVAAITAEETFLPIIAS